MPIKYTAHTLIFFLVITYLLIAVVIPPKIGFSSSNSICHPSSPRKANKDDKILFSLYTQQRHVKIPTHTTEPAIMLVYTKSIL